MVASLSLKRRYLSHHHGHSPQPSPPAPQSTRARLARRAPPVWLTPARGVIGGRTTASGPSRLRASIDGSLPVRLVGWFGIIDIEEQHIGRDRRAMRIVRLLNSGIAKGAGGGPL